MWKKLLDTEYFLLYINNNEIFVTDYISIWSVKFSEKDFLKCLKDSNFGLEMDEGDLLVKGRLILTNPEGLKKVRVKNEGETLFFFLTKSFGFPLLLDLKLLLGSKELTHENCKRFIRQFDEYSLNSTSFPLTDTRVSSPSCPVGEKPRFGQGKVINFCQELATVIRPPTIRELQDSNFGLEMDEGDLLVKGRLILTNPEGLKKVRVKNEGETLSVFLTKSFGFPLLLDLKLLLGSKELFFQKVTLQLLKTVQDLRTSEQELRQLLLRKDKEIAEYKDENGQIVFRSLKTEPFSDEGHMAKHTTYAEYFGEHNGLDCILKKTVVVPKMEVIEIKEEPMDTQEIKVTNKINPDVKLEPKDVKTEASCIKTESVGSISTDSVKSEGQNGENVKTEDSLSQTSVKLEVAQSQHHKVAASPSKRQRKKLNF